ncbi:RNA polymerase sigma factor [Paenibacillus herberti]|uniref:RNA polymerase sigma factor n=1 Tax=Paenibacillus herberti TaxID=1619309 RepID=A0A229P1H8_9BACL|nr:sigma-70 family RNA polymerase sigma factor [Paenibacillus herberti]OXM16126.1 RNA polymerase subunit sigma-24 [Paenibacillus herberti]
MLCLSSFLFYSLLEVNLLIYSSQYFNRIHRIICIKKGPEDAEDLAQKVFVKALEHGDRFRNQSSSFTWLYRITMNTIIDELRRVQIHKRHEKFKLESSLISMDFTSNVEMRIDLSSALKRFNELDREIITLRFFVDCSFEEIASIVGMRKSAVKNRLYRALGKLRTELLNWGGSMPMSIGEWISLVNILEDENNVDWNRAVTDEIFNELKGNLDRITDHFGPLSQKISIEIYPDLEKFHAQTGKPNGPDWYIAMLGNDGSTIKMVSPLNPGPRHSHVSVIKAALSLFATAVALDRNKKIPQWLKSGIGHYEANQFWGDHRKEVKSDIEQGTIPRLTELDGDWGDFTDRKGHMYSYSLVEYIVATYGYVQLRALIRSPNAYVDIFGCSQTEFEGKWMNYLSLKYA